MSVNLMPQCLNSIKENCHTVFSHREANNKFYINADRRAYLRAFDKCSSLLNMPTCIKSTDKSDSTIEFV